MEGAGLRDIQALFITCSNAGVAFWRVDSFVTAAKRNKAGFFFAPWSDKTLTDNHPWEIDLSDSQFKNRILAELWDHGKKADVIVFQMLHLPASLQLFLAMKQAFPNTPIVTECDDNILSTPSYNPADSAYEPGSFHRNVAVEQFRMSDAMIVSTPYLAEVYSEHNRNIHVVPNCLDFRKWDNLKHRRNKDVVRIGWAGGASHDEDLRIIEPVVRKTLEKHPTVRFCFVHGIAPFLRNIDRVDFISQFTRIDRYPQFLASRSFDIGMAPLVDNSFNRAKSNLRWLEYAGLKVPCVASDVGHFKETITQAKDGLLCYSEQDWLDSLDFLIHDSNARKAIGKAANAKARRDFNVDKEVFRYAKILREVAEKGQTVKVPDDELQEANA